MSGCVTSTYCHTKNMLNYLFFYNCSPYDKYEKGAKHANKKHTNTKLAKSLTWNYIINHKSQYKKSHTNISTTAYQSHFCHLMRFRGGRQTSSSKHCMCATHTMTNFYLYLLNTILSAIFTLIKYLKNKKKTIIISI